MQNSKTKVKKANLKEFAKMMGVDDQTIEIKAKLIDTIKDQCEKEKISQRKLASMVPGLTHDRVNKIFKGQLGHMTIDKLLQIVNCLNIKAKITFIRPKKAA